MPWTFSMRTFCIPVIILLPFYVDCLFPYESPTRETKRLDGIWDFKICRQDDQDIGFREEWFRKSLFETGDVLPMPVPSSFNDITQNKTVRDYLGWSWYDTHFYVPQRWKKDHLRVFLRFGSAHYLAYVYLNGVSVMNHTGGHLPFETEVTDVLKYFDLNRLSVALNNTLTDETIPQGSKTFKTKPYPPGFYSQSTNFDFFNYAGIHRSVMLYTVPLFYIKDITIVTDVINNTGYASYEVFTNSPQHQGCFITILNKMMKPVASADGCRGNMVLKNANLWWPFTMHNDPGYQYTLVAEAYFNATVVTDIYFQKFGIRSIKINQHNFLVNDKPFYFMGFGKHEDANIRGKGLDLPIIIKDFNLIKWIGANSFRTSHYPYSEELMDQADDQGIVVIDECPAVGLHNFTETLLTMHKKVMKELIARDKNRPSVFAWSVANEPRSGKPEADQYFQNVVNYAKQLDNTRPITAALNVDSQKDRIGKYMDYIMVNHYYSWYSDTGSTEVIYPLLINAITEAFNVYKKPVMISEYGADTVAGLHMDPPFIFTEDYQTEMMVQHHRAFDMLRDKGFFVGEHIWNFADFMTLQEINRVVGNKKGIFTRERQPKAAARLLRCRYYKLVKRDLDGSVAYCPGENSINEISCLGKF